MQDEREKNFTKNLKYCQPFLSHPERDVPCTRICCYNLKQVLYTPSSVMFRNLANDTWLDGYMDMTIAPLFSFFFLHIVETRDDEKIL
jgi:hypothetical protein